MARHSEKMKRTRQAVKMGLGFQYPEVGRVPKGTFILEMTDARTGERLAYFEKDEKGDKPAGEVQPHG